MCLCTRVLALLCRLYPQEKRLTRVRSSSFSPGPRPKTSVPDLRPAQMKNTRPSWTYSQMQPPELSLEMPASAGPHTGEKRVLLVSAAEKQKGFSHPGTQQRTFSKNRKMLLRISSACLRALSACYLGSSGRVCGTDVSSSHQQKQQQPLNQELAKHMSDTRSWLSEPSSRVRPIACIARLPCKAGMSSLLC
ncbi:unnamed protein product, partial [Rangifer tarandus platyrhynchus]